MILHKLIAHHLRHGDDAAFYDMQAEYAVQWITKNVAVVPGMRVLDLGCGHGQLGKAFEKLGCDVTYSDTHYSLRDHGRERFILFEVGKSRIEDLGQYDLVLFSNVLEHIPDPKGFIESLQAILRPGGVLFLSWTPWLSPWGGHDFSPLHYLGPNLGARIFDWFRPGRRQHFPYAGLWPTYVGQVLRWVRGAGLEIKAAAPRYATEHAWIVRIPWLREFATWNCALLIGKAG